LFFFSLPSSGSVPDPHSFPTRRSSDLFTDLIGFSNIGSLTEGALRIGAEQKIKPGSCCLGAIKQFVQPATWHCQHLAGPVDDLGDRKSTRLNSSHVKISYAVFCLKKKK